MEHLIRQTFLHVAVIGPHVQAGHYDLIGPGGEIVLPQVWEDEIEPGMEITMHTWPMPGFKRPDEDASTTTLLAHDPDRLEEQKLDNREGSTENHNFEVDTESAM